MGMTNETTTAETLRLAEIERQLTHHRVMADRCYRRGDMAEGHRHAAEWHRLMGH